jgi:small subunit ribosomal protein S6
MKTYETVTIVKPQMSDKDVSGFLDLAKALITKAGGEVVSEEKLGRRRFAHDIDKNREGFYLYLKFKAAPQFNKEWTGSMKLNQNVLRSMVINASEPKIRPVKKAPRQPQTAAA